MTEIQTLEESWALTGQDYLENEEHDEMGAHEAHLNDWAGDQSLGFWQYLYKSEGIIFELDEIEQVLILTEGDFDEAVTKLLEEAAQEHPFAEALTPGERNPVLAGAYSD